ncbi:MAG: AAA family ATPase [Massilia sp.]
MKLGELHLTAFGPFTDRVLDFGGAEQSVVFVHGPNEAGKSSTLRAISDLRFGIPQLSRDNFVHEHRNMLLGGVFVDRNDKRYHINRRKGRTGTLSFADGTPVPPELEALITCGLSKEDYEAMFGLDHQRLRDGGAALLAGQGEVGAALFEASAGVRSIPGVLDRLDQAARAYFMPGARGKNARINEALRSYTEHNTEFRNAQVKPAAWAELFKQHQAAHKQLSELEEREREVHRGLRRVTELRAVAPLIRTLDTAHAVLAELDHVRLLAENAATERAAAEAGLSAARANAAAADDTADRLRTQLKALAPDSAVLEAAGAIERLAANAESFDSLRNEIAAAADEVAEARKALDARAAGIRPAVPAQDVLALAPVPAARAAVEETLRAFELAQQRLQQHQESAGALAGDDEAEAADALPAPELRTALRAAQTEATRNQALLQRKEALPTEIKTLQRAIAADLATLDLPDEAALAQARPLLDSEIDAARSEQETADNERRGLQQRLARVKSDLAAQEARRNQLLAGGAVPTAAEVRSVRERRDHGWSLVRSIYVDRANTDPAGYGAGKPLPQAFEDDVREADRLADELARDTERATQLQGSLDEIALLERDAVEIERELAALEERAAAQRARWDGQLAARRLPALAPAALREWQALLADAREQRETLQLRQDELDDARTVERELAVDLGAAIAATGVGSSRAEAALSTLLAMAEQVEDQFNQRERALNTAAGQRQQREKHLLQFKVQHEKLERELATADEAVRERVYAVLHLPLDAGVAAARVRLAEFDALLASKGALDAAMAAQLRAEHALEHLLRKGRELAQALGETAPPDLRLYVEQLMERLKKAKEADTARRVAEQGLEQALAAQREQEATAQRHADTLQRLCHAANVESTDALPEAEEQSRRKREAQLDADRARKDLAGASGRTVEQLRELLRDYDTERMENEEAGSTAELARLESELRSARQAEESARRALHDVDSADTAAAARESMERDAAAVRVSIAPWMRSKLAHGLLGEALKRFRERAQGPMLLAASRYFMQMTDGQFVRLASDDSEAKPVLVAQRANGSQVRVEGLSEGTRDQLYLALRLAALEIRRSAGYDLPVVLDDVLMTSDDARAALALLAISEFSKGQQVIVFTHHAHLLDVAERTVPGKMLQVIGL